MLTVNAGLLLSYFARGSSCEVLWWVCLSVGLSVCHSARLSPEPRAIFTKFFCGCFLCPWFGPPLACLR